MAVHTLLVLLVGALIQVHAYPAPVSNNNLTEPAWGPEPTGRGTAGILTSCSLTLIMCVCTVLHLDICPGRTTFQRIRYKLKYITLGIFTPEVLLVIAIRDLLGAREFRRKWQLVRGFSAGSEGDYGLEGAFFACMGGFTLRRPGGYFKTTVSTETLLKLCQEGLVQPDFTTREIMADKGKSDLVAKSLVCIQALWLIVQCAARVGVGLPVTLLEIHILTHVLCTLVMYMCWMKKPLDVAEQIAVMTDTDLASLIAVNYAKLHRSSALRIEYFPSPAQLTAPPTTGSQGRGQQTESTPESHATNPNYGNDTIPPSSGPAISSTKSSFISEERSVSPERKTHNLDGSPIGAPVIFSRGPSVEIAGRAYPDSVAPGQRLMIGKEIEIWWEPDPSTKSDKITLDKIDIGILISAAAAIKAGKLPRSWALELDKTSLRERGRLWKHRNLPDGQENSLGAVSAYLPIIYGACHGLAWNTHFPTTTERTLWRVSSILVGLIPLTPWIAMCRMYWNRCINRMLCKCRLFLAPLINHEDFLASTRLLFRILSRVLPVGLYRLVARTWSRCLFLCLFQVLMAARLFLVVESFISLRSLPVGSFKTTPWDQYWGHF